VAAPVGGRAGHWRASGRSEEAVKTVTLGSQVPAWSSPHTDTEGVVAAWCRDRLRKIHPGRTRSGIAVLPRRCEPVATAVPGPQADGGVGRGARWKRRLVGPLCGLLAASLIGVNGLLAIGPVQTTDQVPSPPIGTAVVTSEAGSDAAALDRPMLPWRGR